MNIPYETEPVDGCPVCGHEGEFVMAHTDRELYPPFQIRMYWCRKCGCSYHNPRLTQRFYNGYYRAGQYRDHPDRHIQDDMAKMRMRRTLTLLNTFMFNPVRRCLDVGCARGHLVNALAEHYGAEAVGYDLFPDPHAAVEIVVDKEQVRGPFDLITCLHTLEHFAEPMKELEWMAGLLSPAGMLFIEIPTAPVVTIPHPVIFDGRSVPVMMEHIGAEYIWIDARISHLGWIYAWKGKPGQNSTNEF